MLKYWISAVNSNALQTGLNRPVEFLPLYFCPYNCTANVSEMNDVEALIEQGQKPLHLYC